MKREDILAVYAAGPEAVVALVERLVAAHQAQVAELTTRLERLEARLSQDSHNSHKPPSSDGPAKLPPRRSQRKRSGKKSGGQVGHPGATLLQVKEPDTVVPHRASTCPQCQASLASAPSVKQERRQVWDLPTTRPQVTEHQALHLCCPQCQTVTAGHFPADVTQPVQYGPGVKALAVYLQTYQHLPLERTQEYFREVHQLNLSEGTLVTVQASCAERLVPVEQDIRRGVTEAAVVNFDETGLRVDRKTHWLHVAGTAFLTYYALQPKRGRLAMDAIGILPAFQGIAVHDALGGYLTYTCGHSLCNAHLLRDLTAVGELTRQRWPARLIDLLLKIKTVVERAGTKGQAGLSARRLKAFTAQYDQLVNSGLRANPPPKPTGRVGRPNQGPIRSVLLRLQKRSTAVLAFMHDFSVPFDNNRAEQDVRMVKVKQKVSGGFRSLMGAEIFCRIRGYISTMRKQGHNVLAVLTSVFTGQPTQPKLTA
ncbi:MAG: IS66 family transposase [Polaromonas sp.]